MDMIIKKKRLPYSLGRVPLAILQEMSEERAPENLNKNIESIAYLAKTTEW